MHNELIIRPTSSGFGEYEVAQTDGEGYADFSDLRAEIAQNVEEMIDLRADDAAELLADAEPDANGDRPQNIIGRIHNEPPHVFAILQNNQWRYVGIG